MQTSFVKNFHGYPIYWSPFCSGPSLAEFSPLRGIRSILNCFFPNQLDLTIFPLHFIHEEKKKKKKKGILTRMEDS